MAVLSALRRTPRPLQRNPSIFVPILVLASFQLPQLLLRGTAPRLAGIVSFAISIPLIFIAPFFQAGFIGMADEALADQTSLRTFVRDGKSHFIPVFIAFLVVLAANFVFGAIVFFGSLIGGVFFFTVASGGQPSLLLLAIIGLIAVPLLVAYLLLLFFVQFYGQAIVIDDLGPVNGLKRSVSLVRRNLLSVLGYSVFTSVVGGIAGLVFGAASLLASLQTQAIPWLDVPQLPFSGVVGVSLLVLLLATIFGGFFGVYAVAFYHEITARDQNSRNALYHEAEG